MDKRISISAILVFISACSSSSETPINDFCRQLVYHSEMTRIRCQKPSKTDKSLSDLISECQQAYANAQAILPRDTGACIAAVDSAACTDLGQPPLSCQE